MTRIFVTHKIPDEGIKLLKKRKSIKLDIYEKDRQIPRRELLRRAKGADIILSLLTEKIDGQVMDSAGSQLKMISNYAVGFDNIDLAAAKDRKIIVSNTPSDQVNESVAEHAIALIFGLSHRISESDDFTKAGKYKGWNPNLLIGSNVIGKTLGIIGAGRIGEMIIRRVHDGFGVNIIYNNREPKPELEKKYKARYRSKMQLLKEADFVSLHVPLLDSTRHLISIKELKSMKKTAFLINTSRGPVVDEKALVSALQSKQIAGAGLDVYEHEPKIASALKKMPNIILTPHTASATIEARRDMSRIAALNILAFLDSKKIPNQVKL